MALATPSTPAELVIRVVIYRLSSSTGLISMLSTVLWSVLTVANGSLALRLETVKKKCVTVKRHSKATKLFSRGSGELMAIIGSVAVTASTMFITIHGARWNI